MRPLLLILQTIVTAALLDQGDNSTIEALADRGWISKTWTCNYQDLLGGYVLFSQGSTSRVTGLQIVNYTASGSMDVLANLTGLIYLRLDNTSISGSMSRLANLTGLTKLLLHNTQVSGSMNGWTKAINLTRLYPKLCGLRLLVTVHTA